MKTMIEIDGGPGALAAVELRPLTLPVGGGVLLAQDDPWDEPDCLELPPDDPRQPEAFVRALAQSVRPRLIVIYPPLTSPARARLALSVGRLLADRRDDDPAPVVTCGVRPNCAWQECVTVVPHLVSAVTGGAVTLRVIWELIDPHHSISWQDTPWQYTPWPAGPAPATAPL
jgi:hypothetical protein